MGYSDIYDIRDYKEYLEEAKDKLDKGNYQSFNEIINGVISNMENKLEKYPELIRPNPYFEDEK